MKLSLFIRYFPRYVPKPKTAAPGGRWLKSLWDWQVSWDSEQLRASEVTPPVSGRAWVMAGHRGWEEWVARKHMLGGTLGVTGRGEHLGGVSTQGLWLQIASLDTSFLLKKFTEKILKSSPNWVELNDSATRRTDPWQPGQAITNNLHWPSVPLLLWFPPASTGHRPHARHNCGIQADNREL